MSTKVRILPCPPKYKETCILFLTTKQTNVFLKRKLSNNIFNKKAKLSIVCPITNTNNHFPLHIPLDNRTKTTGVILCEHVKALDLNSRTYQVIENLPRDILENVIDVVYSEIEQIED